MIKGVGIDLIEVARIQKSLEEFGDTFLRRLFHPEEIAPFASHKNKAVHIAGRFAAKEAIAKALGCGFGEKLSWHDITIQKSATGQPIATLSPKAASLFKSHAIHLSISHTNTHATAVAVIS